MILDKNEIALKERVISRLKDSEFRIENCLNIISMHEAYLSEYKEQHRLDSLTLELISKKENI